MCIRVLEKHDQTTESSSTWLESLPHAFWQTLGVGGCKVRGALRCWLRIPGSGARPRSEVKAAEHRGSLGSFVTARTGRGDEGGGVRFPKKTLCRETHH
ncbi:hypothetical protein AAFF_G00206070 [Aldrovandia affinis]|uniref:Uncharacterized protein n=1 Tax=Aldrovandia affinis TaxID=143900 RepID=A0AAD7RHM4_9TELE|nr:hypothetical protein AAFF_G00206070 [Aldrovandia affinis]